MRFRFGFWIAVATSATTLLTFALAITALPDEVPYPFTSEVIVEQWPGDYLWMFPAMVLMVLFVAFVATLHEWAPVGRTIFSLIALGLAIVASAVLLIDYYVQATVMPISLEKEQLDGWSILTMYNPSGVFIALEELAYVLMSIVLLCLAPVFAGRSGLERAVRWLFVSSFAATVIALVVVSVLQGRDRGWDFEIIVISIVWLTLIIGGSLVAILLRRGATATAVPTAA